MAAQKIHLTKEKETYLATLYGKAAVGILAGFRWSASSDNDEGAHYRDRINLLRVGWPRINARLNLIEIDAPCYTALRIIVPQRKRTFG